MGCRECGGEGGHVCGYGGSIGRCGAIEGMGMCVGMYVGWVGM